MKLQTSTITHADDYHGPPSIKLDLGIGAGSGGLSPVVIKQRHHQECKSTCFTPAQLHELHQQTLISRYIVAGLPIPFYLVLPISKSFACSFGSSVSSTGIYTRYPTFTRFCPWGFAYKMDTEPGRCRRTDGKKWRCSREVIPDKKYCERHMHRGRLLSRKHVEASKNVSEFISSTSMKTTNFNRRTNVNSALVISNPTNIQSATSSQNIVTSVLAISAATTTCVSGSTVSNRNVTAKDDLTATGLTLSSRTEYNDPKNNISGNRNTPISTVNYFSHTVDKYKCQGMSDYIDRKDVCYSHITGKNIKPYKNNENDGNIFAAPGFDFSPNSVLQVVGCSSSGIDFNTSIDAEIERCRRTDGRKWRCSKNVVPYQKYCEKHMHRGAKRLIVASQQTLASAAVPPPFLATNAQFTLRRRKPVDCINTNLSISMAASPRAISEDEDSSTSNSSSDATTITDENACVAHML